MTCPATLLHRVPRRFYSPGGSCYPQPPTALPTGHCLRRRSHTTVGLGYRLPTAVARWAVPCLTRDRVSGTRAFTAPARLPCRPLTSRTALLCGPPGRVSGAARPPELPGHVAQAGWGRAVMGEVVAARDGRVSRPRTPAGAPTRTGRHHRSRLGTWELGEQLHPPGHGS